MELAKDALKQALLNATTCDIQHDGWTCGTCFFHISPELNNQDWQAVLLIRGDYSRDELDNLPEDIGASVAKVIRLCDVYWED